MPRRRNPTQPPKGPLPEFANYEEEAEFWDSHDLTNFIDESQPVGKLRVAKNLTHGIIVQLDNKAFLTLCAAAEARGTYITTLAQQWIMERLKDEEKPGTTI